MREPREQAGEVVSSAARTSLAGCSRKLYSCKKKRQKLFFSDNWCNRCPDLSLIGDSSDDYGENVKTKSIRSNNRKTTGQIRQILSAFKKRKSQNDGIVKSADQSPKRAKNRKTTSERF
uniref:(northern house mosquito) hypothetical protein n=1 Tax=Culex pipiens TaxID=7175 RepID=A0A8D8C6G5_CULPI